MIALMASFSPVASGWAEAVWRACWQGGLAILLVWGICRAFPRLPAGARCWLWRLAVAKLLLALLLPGAIPLPLRPAPAEVPVAAPAAPEAPAAVQPAALRASAQPAAVPASDLSDLSDGSDGPARPNDPGGTSPDGAAAAPSAAAGVPGAAGLRTFHSPLSTFHFALPALWLLGLAWQLGRLAAEAARAHRWTRAGASPPPNELAGLFPELAARAGLRRAPRLLLSTDAGSPALVGVLRPTILLPAWVGETCSTSEVRLLLAHELAHVRRRDLAWGWLLAAAQALFFFHPLLWLARREWRLAQEMACDEMAVLATGAPAGDYGTALLRVIERRQEGRAPAFAAAGVVESHRGLRARLAGLESLGGISRRPRLLAGGLVAALALFGLVPWRVVARSASDGSEAGQSITFAGKATDEEGRPIAGATVFLVGIGFPILDPDAYEEPLAERVTGRDGAFRFDQVPGESGPFGPTVNLVALHPRYGVSGYAGLVPHDAEGRPAPVMLRLPLPTSVDGTVANRAGRRVPGATVRVRVAYGDVLPGTSLPGFLARRFTTTTNAAGACSLSGLPQRGNVSLEISAPGYATINHTDSYSGLRLSRPFHAVLPPGGEIEGRVVTAERGRPAEGVRLQAHPTPRALRVLSRSPGCVELQPFRHTTTDRGGNFRFPGLAPADWVVRIAEFHQQRPLDAVALPAGPMAVRAGKTVRNVVVELMPGALLTIRAVNARTGKPVPEMPIQAERLGRRGSEDPYAGSTVTTDAQGMVQVRVPAGHIVITPAGSPLGWSLSGKASEERTVGVPPRMWNQKPVERDVADGRSYEITMALDPGVAIAGTVVDDLGRPVAGALVSRVFSSEGASMLAARTDARGGFRVQGFRGGEAVLLAVTRGAPPAFKERTTRIIAGKPGSDRVVLRLRTPNGGALVGRVVDAEGKPVARVQITFGEYQADGLALTRQAAPLFTNAEGRYQIAGVWSGKRYVVYARSLALGARSQSKDVRIQGGGTHHVPDIVLAKAR